MPGRGKGTLQPMGVDWASFTPRRGPVPMYRQLADYIRAAVDRGDLTPGAGLPSETGLADATGVSVDTVRLALAELRKAGVVVTAQGIGSFIAERGGT